MPLTPFIGLSELIHLFVILTHRIFNRGRTSPALMVRKNTRFMNFGVSLVIVCVFSFVMVSAGMLVKASITDEHSSINISEHYIGVFSKMLSENVANHPISKIALLSAGECVKPKVSMSDYGYSVVNYLKSTKQDFSFEARSVLAVANNIEDYFGSSPQNILLLQKILSSQLCKG